MAALRFVFYFLIYVLLLLSGPDILAFLITAPMFFAIILSLINQDSEKIGYIDGIALIYFISFVVVPLQKISNRSFDYSGIGNGVTYPQEYFITVAGLALASYIALAFFLRKANPYHGREKSRIAVPRSFLLIAALLLSLAALLASGSMENLQAARRAREYDGYAFVVTILGAALCVNAVFSILREDRSRVAKYLTCIFCFACLLFVINPMNASRFVLLGVWIPVLLCLFPNMLKPGVFYITVPVILIILLPVLNITTRQGVFELDADTIYGYGKSVFVISYFDLFECCCEALRYISRFGSQNGDLLLFTVATFIPRSIWPDKPINSGLLIGRMNVRGGLHNENLAVPWFMDGYMDFGFIGSVLYALALAGAFVLIRKRLGVRVNGVDLAFLMFIANIAILLRGTLGVVMYLYIAQLLGLLLYSRMFLRRASPLRANSSPLR